MPQSRTHQKAALSVSSLAHIVQDGLSLAVVVLLPTVAQAFGLSYAQVGLLKGISNAAQAVFEFCSGWIADWMGAARLIVFGLAVTGLGYLSLATAGGLPLIILALVLIGIGTALHHAPSSALIAGSFPMGRRTSALGFYNAAGDVGKLIFTGAFSLAVAVGLASAEISLLYGIAGLGAAIGALVLGRSLMVGVGTDDTGDTPSSAPAGWGVLNWRAFGALITVTGIDTIVQSGVFLFMAFLMLAKGMPLWLATGATVILLAGGVAGKSGAGLLADRIGARPAFALMQGLSALGLVAVVVSPGWLALVLLAPLGVVVQGTSSITYGFAANLFDTRRAARGYALLYSSGTIASTASPFVFGWIGDIAGINATFFLLAGISVFAIPLMLLLPRTTPDSPADHA